MEGKGKYQDSIGNVYEGDWKSNMRNGKGILYYANGDVFEGEWIGNMKFGIGVLKDSKGNVKFNGVWKSNKEFPKNKWKVFKGLHKIIKLKKTNDDSTDEVKFESDGI
jgi:hypothetical protein